MSPMSRSLKLLRSRGCFVEKTEYWNSFTKTRKDLFGFCDILMLQGNDTVAVQTTTRANVTARIAKIVGLESVRLWLNSTNRKIVVHGWSKKGERGRMKRWTCDEFAIDASMVTKAPQTREMIGARPRPKPRAGSKRKKG